VVRKAASLSNLLDLLHTAMSDVLLHDSIRLWSCFPNLAVRLVDIVLKLGKEPSDNLSKARVRIKL
jgi:hypothetical protein